MSFGRTKFAWIAAALLTVTVAMAEGPVFDVASLKPSPQLPPGQNYNANLGSARLGEVALTNATLVDCIKFAYGLVSDEQLAGPEWTKSKEVRFDILAKAPPATPRDQLLLMLRNLLAERFHLAMHTEQRAFFHYALVIGKNGPKLKEVPPDPLNSHMTYRIGNITHNQISMQTLTLLLSRQLRELVLDRTGLKGAYDLSLKWIPEAKTETADAAETGPTIFMAVQDQLGLKLEPRKDAVEVLVIDHADRVPVEN